MLPSSLAETVSSTGTLLAVESVELQAEVSGKITAINFVEGARVRKGDLLVKLNDADLQARRLATGHELALAERREQRIAELLKQGFVIPDDHDEALNDVQVRRAEIALTDAQIAKTEIRAPFDGVAGLRYVSEGAFVGATTRIATLQRIDTLKVDFAVPEKYADKSSARQPDRVHALPAAAQKFGGEVYAYDPRIDQETRTLLHSRAVPESGRRAVAGRVRERGAHARARRKDALHGARRGADPGLRGGVRVRREGRQGGAAPRRDRHSHRQPRADRCRVSSRATSSSPPGCRNCGRASRSSRARSRRRACGAAASGRTPMTLPELSIRRPVLTHRGRRCSPPLPA